MKMVEEGPRKAALQAKKEVLPQKYAKIRKANKMRNEQR